MAYTNVTSDISAPISTLLHRGLLSSANRCCPYFVGSVPGNMMSAQGSHVMTWEKMANLAAATTALGETTANAYAMGRTAVTPSVSTVTATMAKFGNYIEYSEEIDLTQVNANTMAFIDRLGENAGYSLNLKQRDILDGATTDRFASGAAGTTSTIDEVKVADLQQAVRTLGNNSAMRFRAMATGSTNVGTSPVRPSYIGICHVDNAVDLRAIAGWVSVEQYGGYTDTYEGEIGAVEGIRFIETESAPIAEDAGTTSASGFLGTSDVLNDVYSIFILGREAHGSIGLDATYDDEIYKAHEDVGPVQIIQHLPGSAGTGDPFNESGTVAWKAWWAGALLTEDWMFKIECLATEL